MQQIKARAAGIVLALLLAGGLITTSEGTRYVPYRDPVGILTVCEGHTGPDIVPGKRYTLAECEGLKQFDMIEANRTVDRCITAPLTPGQRASLIDFAFNVGPGRAGVKDGLCTLKSGAVPTIRRLFNAQQYAAACAQYPLWNAQKLPGITKRREAERQLCLTAY